MAEDPGTTAGHGVTKKRLFVSPVPAGPLLTGRYTTFQMAEVAAPRQMFQEIVMLIAQLRAPPAPA